MIADTFDLNTPAAVAAIFVVLVVGFLVLVRLLRGRRAGNRRLRFGVFFERENDHELTDHRAGVEVDVDVDEDTLELPPRD